MKLFLSVGEPSGDAHAAHLIEHFRSADPTFTACGFGGPRMKTAGFDLRFELTNLAIMGGHGILGKLGTFFRLAKQAEEIFDQERPDGCVLIDFPGFNMHIAKRAKQRGIPVFWYCPPQTWAWGGWRIKKVRKYVDHVICTLPFEYDYYRSEGVSATLVGHPYFDELATHVADANIIYRYQDAKRPLITILPGSRDQEIRNNLDVFLKAAKIISRHCPEARFAIAAYKDAHAETARLACEKIGLEADVHVGKTLDLIAAAHSCLAVSGSVSLQLLWHAKPTVIHYKLDRFHYTVGQFVRRVKYITLVNLIATGELHPRDLKYFSPDQPDADQIPMPEYVTLGDASNQLAAHFVDWLGNPKEHARRVGMLSAIRSRVTEPGATGRAAAFIQQQIGTPTNNHAKAA